jgi:hypothetical protein
LVCLFIYLFWPDLKLCPNGGTKQTVHIIVGVAIGAVCLLLFLGNPLVGRLFVEKKRGKNRYRLYQLLDSQITYFF